MTREELIEKLLSNYNERNKDDEVVIVITEPHVGPLPMVSVAMVQFGIDWEKGRILLYPQQNLERIK